MLSLHDSSYSLFTFITIIIIHIATILLFVVLSLYDSIVISFNILRDSIRRISTAVPLAPRFLIRIPLIDGLVDTLLMRNKILNGIESDVEMVGLQKRMVLMFPLLSSNNFSNFFVPTFLNTFLMNVL